MTVGTRVITTNMNKPKYDNTRGAIVDGKTPPGRLAVKFDDPALGTKAIRVENLKFDRSEDDDAVHAEDDDKPKPIGGRMRSTPRLYRIGPACVLIDESGGHDRTSSLSAGFGWVSFLSDQPGAFE